MLLAAQILACRENLGNARISKSRRGFDYKRQNSSKTQDTSSLRLSPSRSKQGNRSTGDQEQAQPTSVLMKSTGSGAGTKRMKPDMEEKDGDEVDLEILEKEKNETVITGSEEMELNISHILEKIETYTQMVSELLEAVKTTFKELSNEFEERLIMIHKEQIEKWQEEIRELRTVDASNEEANALLHNAHYLLQHTRIG